MRQMSIQANPLIKVSQSKRALKEFLVLSNVSVVTAMKKSAQVMIATRGATNQLMTIIPSLNQLMLDAPNTAKPEPMMEPTMVCVPEMGTPKTEEVMMKRNELIEMPSII